MNRRERDWTRGRSRMWGRAAALIGGAVGAGCAPTASTLFVEVRDAATLAPAQGVVVCAEVPHRNHPLSIASLLGSTAGSSSRARTDDQGRATLEYFAGRPVRVSVLASGWAVGCVECDVGGGWVESVEPDLRGVKRPSVRCVVSRE